MKEDDENQSQPITPDLSELGELCGCSEKQMRFAERLLQGANFTEAAFGIYAGERDSVQLRSAGSSAARAKPVQALLALAESRGLGVPSAPGDKDELVRILWTHARSKDKQSSIKATAELNRIIEAEQLAKAAERADDYSTILDEIAEINPELALHCATKAGVEWKPAPTVQEQVQAARKAIALEYLNQQRAQGNA